MTRCYRCGWKDCDCPYGDDADYWHEQQEAFEDHLRQEEHERQQEQERQDREFDEMYKQNTRKYYND